MSRGSAAELETLLTLAGRTGVLDRDSIAPVFELTEEVGRMLNALRSKLSQETGGFSEEDQSLIPNP
jgi:four helix bundle protein